VFAIVTGSNFTDVVGAGGQWTLASGRRYFLRQVNTRFREAAETRIATTSAALPRIEAKN